MLLPGPGTVSRPALPNVNGALSVNAFVLKNSTVLRWLRGRAIDCPGTMFGRLIVPELALSVPKQSAPRRLPPPNVTTILACQPPTHGRRNCRFGRLWPAFSATRRPALMYDRPRSRWRLRSSCAPALSYAPCTTLSVSSIDFDHTKLPRIVSFDDSRFSTFT